MGTCSKGNCCCWSICGHRFWNNFCQPRQRGVFLVLALTCAVLTLLIFFIYFAFYFEALSKHHSDAYLIIFVANLLLLILSILVLHFLSVPPKSLTFLRAATIYSGLIITAALSATAIVLWNTTPSNGDIRRHVTNFFHQHHRVPRIYDRLQLDHKCCGVGPKGFLDYVPKYRIKNGSVEILPDSCCRRPKRRVNCGNFRGPAVDQFKPLEEIRNNNHFHTKGCFAGSNFTYANLKRMSRRVYWELNIVLQTVWISPILITLLFMTFTYYACYVLPKDKEEGPEWVQDKFKAKLRSSLQCFRTKGDGLPGSTLDFGRLHEQMNPKRSSTKEADADVTSSGSGSAVNSEMSVGLARASSTSDVHRTGRNSFIPIGTSSGINISIDKHGHFIVTDSSPRGSTSEVPQPGRSSGQGSPEPGRKSDRKSASWFGS